MWIEYNPATNKLFVTQLGAGSNTPQFGLIAEEVAEVNPDLVVRDESREIYTVRPVSVGGQAAKDGTPFAKIENPVAADAELFGSIQRRHDHCQHECGQCEERTGSRLNACGDFTPGQNQNESRQNNGWKEDSLPEITS